MATITAPKGWSANRQTKLHTITADELNSLNAYRQHQVMTEVERLALFPMTVTASYWEEIQFQSWCDEKAKDHYE